MTGSDEATWRGKSVDTLTREEAIEAVKVLGQLYYSALEGSRREREMWREIVRAKEIVA